MPILKKLQYRPIYIGIGRPLNHRFLKIDLFFHFRYHYMEDKMLLTYPLMMDVVSKNSTMSVTMGNWGTKAGFKKAGGYEHSEIPRFFRKSKFVLNYSGLSK